MRKPRYFYNSSFFHVMVQGDEKKYIFEDNKNKKKFLYLLEHNAFRNDVEIIAYCIMDNHVHVLVFCPDVKRLSKMMLQCNTSYGLYYNRKRQKIGHVFRDRYRCEEIYTKSHLINCIKYIHENPVKAKICDRCEKYVYSSYNSFRNISNNVKEICELSDDDIDKILKNTHTDSVYMDDEYSKEDIKIVVDEILGKNVIIKDDTKTVLRLYKEIKDRCRISDTEIAKIFGIDRYRLFRLLKKEGMK